MIRSCKLIMNQSAVSLSVILGNLLFTLSWQTSFPVWFQEYLMVHTDQLFTLPSTPIAPNLSTSLQTVTLKIMLFSISTVGRTRWPRSLRCGFAHARLLGLWVWIPLGAWLFVSCQCCVLGGRGLSFGLITRPEESYRVWCVSVWSWSLDNEKRWPTTDYCAT